MPIENPKDQETDEGQSNQQPSNPFVLKIGEREYTSPDEVVTKVTHQDEHIKKIEEENQRLLEALEANKLSKENDVVSKIDQVLSQLDNVKATPDKDAVSTEELVKRAVSEMLDQRLTQKEQDDLEKSNDDLCMLEARKAYGEENYQKTLAKKAAELNMPVERANQLARVAPEAWKKLFVPASSPTATPSTSTFHAPGATKADDGQPPKTEKSWSKMTQKERIAYTHSYMNISKT